MELPAPLTVYIDSPLPYVSPLELMRWTGCEILPANRNQMASTITYPRGFSIILQMPRELYRLNSPKQLFIDAIVSFGTEGMSGNFDKNAIETDRDNLREKKLIQLRTPSKESLLNKLSVWRTVRSNKILGQLIEKAYSLQRYPPSGYWAILIQRVTGPWMRKRTKPKVFALQTPYPLLDIPRSRSQLQERQMRFVNFACTS